MDALGLKLNPISKLKIYRVVRKIVLAKMDGNTITPERTMEIIAYTKEQIVKVTTATLATRFCGHLAKKFPELANLSEIFEGETAEKYDELVTKIVDEFMEKNEIVRVDKILESVKKCGTADAKRKLLADLQKKYPREYETALENILKK